MSQYITIKLPFDIGEKLRGVAKKNYRSMSSQISYMLDKCYSREETFEEYYERNKAQLESAYNETLNGNCYQFGSWKDAQDFLENKKKEWASE
jgi:hypothetical protein